jgi:hypothetical protein
MSNLKFEGDDEIVPTRSASRKRAVPEEADAKEKGEKPDKPENRRRHSEQSKRMPLYVGLGVGAFVVVVLAAVVVALSLGGVTSSGSFTDKALRAYIDGYGADFHRKGKTPNAKQIAEVKSRLHTVKPGTVADFRQGLRILNERRDMTDYQIDTLATSDFVRSKFFEVFNRPIDEPSKSPWENLKIWHHHCSDGNIEILGVPQIQGTDYMQVRPPKTNNPKNAVPKTAAAK